jgi:hypothetical protein
MSGNPQEATSGLLSLAYFAKITVPHAERSHQDAERIAEALKRRLETHPLPGAKVTGVPWELPPGGVERFVVGVTATVQLDEWNGVRGLAEKGQEVAECLGEVLADTDLPEVPGARIDAVELQFLVAG